MATRRQKRKNSATGQVRITAGQWRGRKIPVPTVQNLRPTGDRVRETVFNWLQAYTAGARCLDLFAGSGVLGFEALSRAARSVTFVEIDAAALHNIEQSCHTLQIAVSDQLNDSADLADGLTTRAHLIADTAARTLHRWCQLKKCPTFDLVFIDPPFQLNCQWEMLHLLAPQLLAESAFVYVEAPLSQPIPTVIPAGYEVYREKSAGDVVFRLFRYCKPQ